MVIEKIKDQIKSAVSKEVAILIAGLIPLSAVTVVTLWGGVTIPIWVLIWMAVIAESE